MTSAVYPYLAVACPKCDARPGSPCTRRAPAYPGGRRECREHVARRRALEQYEASRRSPAMTNAKSMYSRDARNLTPFRYIGESVPPRADGLAAPLPHGSTVYLDAKAVNAWRRQPERAHRAVNGRQDGFGASWYVRLMDLRPVEVTS